MHQVDGHHDMPAVARLLPSWAPQAPRCCRCVALVAGLLGKRSTSASAKVHHMTLRNPLIMCSCPSNLVKYSCYSCIRGKLTHGPCKLSGVEQWSVGHQVWGPCARHSARNKAFGAKYISYDKAFHDNFESIRRERLQGPVISG